jgi:hypothetical protein
MKAKWSWARVGLVSALVAIGGAIALPSFDATAQRRGGRLRAQVYLTQARIPGSLTERSLIGFARGHSARILNETTEAQLNDRKWLANLVVAFNAPVNDLEYHILFYDIEDGPRRFIVDMNIFVNDRNQRTFVQPIRLPRPTFRPNRRTELVVTVSRQEVGSARFAIAGEEPRRTGQVNFSDDEAR